MKTLPSSKICCSNCKALCCRLEVRLIDDSDEQVPAKYTEQTKDLYFRMKCGDDGWCEALDRTTMLCLIYDKRPYICREYGVKSHDCLVVRANSDLIPF